MNFSNEATELISLLADDQDEWQAYARAEFVEKVTLSDLTVRKETLRVHVHERAQRMLQILDKIGLPLLSNIGSEAAQAVSVLAMHDSINTTRRILTVFETAYEQSPDDTYITSIPALTDWLAVLERHPQRFGTIWLFDDSSFPFLPTVEDFEHVNQRRAIYGVEPLRWPRSMVLPENDQPWLTTPLTELVMREPTQEELKTLSEFY